jgi:hypothetical protein
MRKLKAWLRMTAAPLNGWVADLLPTPPTASSWSAHRLREAVLDLAGNIHQTP